MGRKSKTQFTAEERAKETRTKAEEGRDIMLTLPERVRDRILSHRARYERERNRKEHEWGIFGRLNDASTEYLNALRDVGLIDIYQWERLLAYIQGLDEEG